MANLNSIQDQSVEYDDVNQEFYRVRNALSLIEMWPHIHAVEGYILLWYLHPDRIFVINLLNYYPLFVIL